MAVRPLVLLTTASVGARQTRDGTLFAQQTRRDNAGMLRVKKTVRDTCSIQYRQQTKKRKKRKEKKRKKYNYKMRLLFSEFLIASCPGSQIALLRMHVAQSIQIIQ